MHDADAVVPLPNVTGRILAKVIEYSKFHTEAKPKKEGEKQSKTEEDIKTFDTEFVKVDQGTLFELILVSPATLHLRRTVDQSRFLPYPNASDKSMNFE